MQRYLWMRPALQKSEAVLLPALTRRTMAEDAFGFVKPRLTESPFRPIPEEGQQLALSTFVRPRGSMAGRGVLRAAGVTANPYAFRDRSRYRASRAHARYRW